MTQRVRVASHAKVNLLLRVLSREASGYHGIETIFALVELADRVTLERIPGGIELDVEGADTGPAEENLAYRAADLVLAATGRRFGVRIALAKTIPVRAGLGGGSSNGAAALHGVNALAGNPVPRHEILQLAARLGSDVPFFAAGAALALGWNRGERLFRLAPPAPAPALVAVPPFGVSTPEAYGLLDTHGHADGPRRGSVLLDGTAFDTWASIGRLGGNDFESVVFGREPRLRALFERVAETRPLVARLSGSGSAVVALYRTEGEREDAAMMVGERDQRLIRTATRSAAAPSPEPF